MYVYVYIYIYIYNYTTYIIIGKCSSEIPKDVWGT